MATRHLIIGGGTAGMNAIRTIREEEGERSEIALVSAETPYSRMVLPYYLDRSIAESHVFTATPRVLADWGVKAQVGRRATALDTKANVCILDDGTRLEYDDCLIATGSSAVRAPVPGADGRGVHSFWTLEGAQAAPLRRGRGSRLRRRDHGDGHQDQPRVAQGLRRHGQPRRRRGRPSALERPERLRRGGHRRGARPDHGRARGPRDRADGPGARAGRRRQHGRQGRPLPRQPHRQHRRGLPPRRGVVRRVGRRKSGDRERREARPARLPEAPLARGPADGRDHPGPVERHLDDQRRRHAQGARAVRRVARPLQGAPQAQPVRRQAGFHRVEDHERAAPRDHPGPSVQGAREHPGGRMTPAIGQAQSRTTTPSPAHELPRGYAGKLLRVDLTKKKCWAEPWSADEMRELLGGVGLGAMILYRETATKGGRGNVSWDHPDNRLILATGPMAGLPAWGSSGLTVVTIGAGTNGPTSTQANGFFGTNLKYSGYDAIVIQGQSRDWVYLYINDDAVELRDAKFLVGKDTWATQDALGPQLGLSGHMLSVYSIGPAGVNLSRLGALPIKNYTTNVPPVDMSQWEAPKLREGFDHRGHQCSACGMHHCHMSVIRKGDHKGAIVDEPEYEGWSGAGWAIGAMSDIDGVAWLNTELDKACLDVNEFGWICGWVMECQEKGYLTEAQVGFRLTWGDIKGAARLIQMISHRQGFGNVLAEGVKRAAENLGSPAKDCAIYTEKGAAPRGHDHRARCDEMLDTCTSGTGTLESGVPVHPAEIGQPTRINTFDGEAVAKFIAGIRGRRNFEDSLGMCIFTTRTRLENLCRVLNAATGWDVTVPDTVRFGRRTAAILRAASLRCGLTPDLERPSTRYGSTPVDGPAKRSEEHTSELQSPCNL